MNLSIIASLVAIAISVPLLMYNLVWTIKHRSQVRRFLKLLVTGRYEQPKKEA